jgi:hypothetical protein
MIFVRARFNHGSHSHFFEEVSIVIEVALIVITKHVEAGKPLPPQCLFAKGGQFLGTEKLLRGSNGATTDPSFFRGKVTQGEIKARDALDNALETGLTD